MEQRRSAPSITERIRTAGGELGVSKAEIWQAMTIFCREGNVTGLKEMFDAYHAWEIRQAPTSRKQRSSEEIRDLALRNFDYVASIADNLSVTAGNEASAVALSHAEIPPGVAGPIRQFYRNAVQYNPQSPKLN